VGGSRAPIPADTETSTDGSPSAIAADTGTQIPPGDAGGHTNPPVIPDSVLAGLKTGASAHTELCADDHLHPNFPHDADLFIRVFCADLVGGQVPNPQSLQELQALLGLDFKNPNGKNGADGNPGFVLAGHSSSLVARFVSAINPRVILFTPPPADGSPSSGYVALAFARGDSFVEVAAHDPVLDQVVLYLIRFQKACASMPGGCAPHDLLTPEIEKGWQLVTSYTAATEINDTIFDCFQCHQPSGPRGRTILRMQEFGAPYSHFFSSSSDGGRALLADFHGAHGTSEDYGGIPGSMIDQSDPALLKRFVESAGFAPQPNAFDSATIEAEVQASAPSQPAVNVPMGKSSTWDALYAQARAGSAIAVPYHDVKVTDPGKLNTASMLYQSVQLGRAPPGALTDIRDVFLDEGLRDMGFAPAAGLDGHALLVQTCQQCHNNLLDQTVSRALFNVERLDLLPRARKLEAIRRLQITDPSDPAKMPPALFRTIGDDERQRMIEEVGR
jgi:hypothetical protein